jgi:molecular chaperone HscB
MQWSVRINEAYQRLRDPLKRAAYLCELGGAAVNAENNTAMPAAFLMQQMEWREELEDASDLSRLESLSREVIQAAVWPWRRAGRRSINCRISRPPSGMSAR